MPISPQEADNSRKESVSYKNELQRWFDKVDKCLIGDSRKEIWINTEGYFANQSETRKAYESLGWRVTFGSDRDGPYAVFARR